MRLPSNMTPNSDKHSPVLQTWPAIQFPRSGWPTSLRHFVPLDLETEGLPFLGEVLLRFHSLYSKASDGHRRRTAKRLME